MGFRDKGSGLRSCSGLYSQRRNEGVEKIVTTTFLGIMWEVSFTDRQGLEGSCRDLVYLRSLLRWSTFEMVMSIHPKP